MNKLLHNILSLVVPALAITACAMDNGDGFEFTELGITMKTVEIPARTMYSGGAVVDSLRREISIYSNKECVVKYAGEEVDWMRMKDETGRWPLKQIAFSGDCTFSIECDQNDDYARGVKLAVYAVDMTRCDTIYVRQAGKRYPVMTPASGTMIIRGSASGTSSIAFETNIDDVENIKIDITYPDPAAADWVEEVTLTPENITVKSKANPSAGDLRFSTVTMSYTDGEGTEYPQVLYLVQKTSSDGLGKTMTFSDVRALGAAGSSKKIEDNILIEGYVVSAVESGNTGDNEKTSPDAADHSAYKRNLYLESVDGTYGFLVRCATEEDNVFSRYDRVTLLLRGTELLREDNPERYRIDGLTTANIIERKSATSGDVPHKEKYISELTDNDIYTYVTLKDCEFGVRKGSLTPVNEGYTLGSGKGNLTKYPRLVRDSRGSSIYIYTNTTCPYRRNGVRLPYGSGRISGVVVFELYPGYVYGDGVTDDESGTIGRYQIRHQSYEDIALDKETSFSSTLVEYCYTSGFKKDGRITYFEPTYGKNGRFRHSSGDQPVKPLSTFNYIGWTGNSKGQAPFYNNIGFDTSIAEPLGYMFGEGITFDYSNTNKDGLGKVGMVGDTEIMDGWRCKKWWNDSTDEPYSWIAEFSTVGISATHISLIFTAYGGETGEVGKSPYYWKVQWSLTGDDSRPEDWKDVADYVVPDGVVSGKFKDWQLPAMKQYDIPLPLDILGQDKVYVRLRPSSKVTNTLYFNEGVLESGADASNALDYFAIRYN
ncbi:MAG: DUF5689 domain-containing protein [Candidatus Cryptobacteroides sp.]